MTSSDARLRATTSFVTLALDPAFRASGGLGIKQA